VRDAMSNGWSSGGQHRIVAVSVLLVIALAFALLPWFSRQPRPHITVENFRKVKHGMTQQEVEYILGGPSGDYASGHQYCVMACEGSTCSLFDNPRYGWKAIPPEQIQLVSPNGRISVWRGADCAIGVAFDENGRVSHVGVGWAWQEPTILERIRVWLQF
jgi:hypothetical protein